MREQHYWEKSTDNGSETGGRSIARVGGEGTTLRG